MHGRLVKLSHKMLMNHIMIEVVVMLSFFAYLLRLKNIIALALFHQEFELTSFQCQLKGPNKFIIVDGPSVLSSAIGTPNCEQTSVKVFINFEQLLVLSAPANNKSSR